MLAPGDDPEAAEGRTRAARRGTRVESDVRCPWCGRERIRVHKKMPNPRGAGILAYVFFPIALGYWLSSTTYNECLDCGGRWQRGVPIPPKWQKAQTEEAEPAVRAGMYAQQVPAAAVVRRRPRLGAERGAVVPASGDVEVKASPGACRRCREAAGRYDVRDAPALPIAGCTCVGGCTCQIVPAED